MARASGIVLILLVVISASFFSNTEARKLLSTSGGDGGGGAISVRALLQSLLLRALPKGTSPSKKGQSTKTLDNVERFQRHIARMDRILGSVPSPGVGH
ncbi:unnamed protein product [Linum tenue]|uniref:Uncharacterized protein n=1 Tax=Linum tenue TaxID=586396 RepID=A0AAV0RTA2_9ROSI|nr:unnamed protein product [Linum tenue]